jgi:hypothetical protein
MEENGMGFDPVPEADKMARKEQLVGQAGVTPTSIFGTTFYK